MRAAIHAAVLTLVLAGGCGMGLFESESGGADNLPTLGAGPYGKPQVDFDTPADEPYVLEDSGASLVDPSVLERADGGFRLWFGREPDNTENQSEIWYAEIPDITELPDQSPRVTLTATEPWEEDRVAAPSVIALGDDHLVMYYEAGVAPPAIGRADSTDGGQSWQKSPENPVLGNATEPSVIELDGMWRLYITLPGSEGIFLAESEDGIDWVLDDTPVLVPRPDLPEAFDSLSVSDPGAIARVTEAGQILYGMFFNGTNDDGVAAIGYAGSFDGVAWERFGGPDAVLHPVAPEEHGPSAVLRSAQGFLFFHEQRLSRQRITVAVHP